MAWPMTWLASGPSLRSIADLSRSSSTLRDRLGPGVGNPGQKEDWYTVPKTGETIDFITFAHSEGRFRKQFDKEGNPSETLLRAQADLLANWHLIQEMVGIR